ncbi:hypothetical protein C8J30_10581 [Rhodobacter viridis]|uniref:Lipoprotein n=1 Tax=Rhodobacter viridis TaxID=1054202 RepID=A0A318TYM7_9RHOB|nr:hypothetical protein [Rhodobacter viridis]PYF10272.1 hypothetical protein C8J30_10581 [Rhodobacter viridis]
MRFAVLLPAALALSACAALPAPEPNPERIDLLSNRLTVHFSDGSRCAADIAAAPSGTLPGCAVAMAYSVTIRHKIHVPGAEALMEPYATVRLTRSSDGHVFDWVTPEGGADRQSANFGHQPG